jgi:hypothetical protein
MQSTLESAPSPNKTDRLWATLSQRPVTSAEALRVIGAPVLPEIVDWTTGSPVAFG